MNGNYSQCPRNERNHTMIGTSPQARDPASGMATERTSILKKALDGVPKPSLLKNSKLYPSQSPKKGQPHRTQPLPTSRGFNKTSSMESAPMGSDGTML